MIFPFNFLQGTTTTTPLILDTYTTGTAGYSLRKLRNAYAGSAIRVRRSSDNTEQDIGFVANVLDTASLLSFCLATDGFVTKWYSQVGGSTFDILQTTAIKQPKIVSTGALNTLNLLACVTYAIGFPTANSSALVTAAGVTVTTGQWLICAVASSASLSGAGIVDQDDQSSPSNRVAQYIYRTGNVFRNLIFTLSGSPTYYSVNSPTFTTNTQIVFNSSKVATTLYSGLNNDPPNTVAFPDSLKTAIVRLSVGCGNNGISEFFDGSIQEVITFDGDNSANKTAIITNIKSYYGIV